MEPHLNEMVQYGFYALMGVVTTYGVGVLSSLRGSVDRLNVKIAVVIERSDQHDRILDRHDGRLAQLEMKRSNAQDRLIDKHDSRLSKLEDI